MGKEYDLRKRTMCFALNIRTLCRQFPDNYEGCHVRGQLFRAGTGLSANYRAACRGRSKPDFIAKLGTAIEEGDEADFWLEFSATSGLLRRGSEAALRKEADELIRILIQSQITARENMERQKEEKVKVTSAARVFVIALLAMLLQYALFTVLH